MRISGVSVSERFWAHVIKDDPCWHWDKEGKDIPAHFRISKKPSLVKHADRVAWELTHREDLRSSDLIVHKCGNLRCLNPGHMFVRRTTRKPKRPNAKIPALDRFMRHVTKTDSCWLWSSKANINGYGYFDDQKAHRFSYETFVGPIPEGLMILHSCDTPACVNPAHLRPGTAQENMNDAKKRGRLAHQQEEKRRMESFLRDLEEPEVS